MYSKHVDIEINNWPKRRRAMLTLLREQQRNIDYITRLAEKLANKLDRNNHPQCAEMIRNEIARVHTVRDKYDL
jgi:hypothetical protein